MPVSKVANPQITEAYRKLGQLMKARLRIGIPGSAGLHDDSTVSNAVIGYRNEFGEPDKNLPARPFLIPGVVSVKAQIADKMALAAATVLAGGPLSAAKRQMEAAGLIGADAARTKLQDGPFAPLALSTIQARARKRDKFTGRLSRAAPSANARKLLTLLAQGAPLDVLNDADVGLARPLLVTGQLKNSITYVVED